MTADVQPFQQVQSSNSPERPATTRRYRLLHETAHLQPQGDRLTGRLRGGGPGRHGHLQQARHQVRAPGDQDGVRDGPAPQ